MKAQIVILSLLATVVSTSSFATNLEPKQGPKKTQKSKYDFNIFKLYSIVVTQELPDSLKTNTLIFPLYKKEN
ncbi:MAG: hypothetical protein HRT73_10060 [Flavobacteriales bacterium]|nr:hypothetical protein [Flavobacteriales bacterium]NQX98208.1 hypothetical protein [Flavobacteriales bacterium]